MSGPTPVLVQAAFAGRCDTGNETSVTWKFADGTCNDTASNATNRDWTQAVDENFRVRFVVQETAGGAEANFKERLEYNLKSAGWIIVTETSSVVRMFLSTQFAHSDDTTQQIGSGSFITDNDGMNETNPPGSSMVPDFAGSDEVEFEFCVQIRSGDVVDTDTIELRVTNSGTEFDTYSQTPTITVSEASAAVAPVIPIRKGADGAYVPHKEEFSKPSFYPLIRFPFPTSPVIPYRMGQDIEREPLLDGVDPAYYPTVTFPVVAAAASPVIQYRIGQNIERELQLNEATPSFYPTITFPVVAATANPVILYRIGQRIEREALLNGANPSFYPRNHCYWAS